MDECMLNDLLECSVCLERLDTSSKVLPCQHTFCKKCLEEILSTHRELRCPECRVLVDVKIDDLPPNVLLMRILEGMRNATPRAIKTPVRGVSGPQRLLGGHQVAPVSTTANQVPITVTPDQTRQTNSAAKQVHLHNQPYGRAIYDYISKVPGDLSFKKGDIVILHKKIDNNWYFGECGNSHGVFPLSYVQVMTPLPPHVPQCKALYDFRMTNDDEDGCLTFNKGEVISVIRRVDENWAEGKLLDRIGIFPLAFVELNTVARALMKLSTNAQPGPSRVAPPTPTNEETTPLIPTDHSRHVQAASQPRPQIPLASTLPMSDSSSIVSSGGSSTTTTPNTPNSSNTSSSSSTAPSSPSSPAATSPPAVGSRHSMKRHSFTAINSGHHPHTHHRHSAEILSPAIDASLSGAGEPFSPVQTSSSTDDRPGVRHRRSGSSDLVLSQPTQNMLGTPGSSHLPAAYIAVYPYKPQKADELELRKGAIYVVTERCQDGWFKGTSNRTQKCGVFPGNYVAPTKSQLQVRNICRTVASTATSTATHQGNQSPSVSMSCNEPRPCITYTRNKGAAPQPQGLRPPAPPELPPRTASPASGISSSWHAQGDSQNQTQSQTNEQSMATNPLGRSHSAVMSTNLASPGKQTMLPLPLTDLNRSPNNTLRSAATVNPPPNTSVATGMTKTGEKKEKKDKGVSLMRRLTNIKKSKSPPPASYSMDNPVFDDGNTVTVINPVHVRSGSCPSQLLQVCPQLDVNTQNTHHRLYNGSGSSHGTTSQRLKHKERPSLPVSFIQRAGDNGVSNAAMGSHHRKSNSLDAGTGKPNKQQSSGRERDRVYRFRCIVPYPPNSEFELELRVGDIIHVHKKRDDGWYKGTLQRTGRTGLFPASFVESF